MPAMLSLFSRRHHRSLATSPALLLVATSLSTSAIHPPSTFSLSSRSHCRPTATTLPPPLSLSSLHPLHIRPLSLHLGIIDFCRLLSLTSTVGFFLRRGRYRCRLLSLSSLLLFLRLPDILLWVISTSARTSMASKLIALDPPPPLVHSLYLFSPSASTPSSLIDAAAVASFTVAPPPTKTSCRCRLPYSSSTNVVAASLFLHRCLASPPATQEDPRPSAPPPLLVSASVRCHGLELEMGIG